MATTKLIIQSPSESRAILNAYRALASGARFSRSTGLFAFASERGARLLVAALSESPHWASATKRWVISIDGGITEPKALQFLLGLNKSEVRVPDAEKLLKRRFVPAVRFHPKTLLLEHGSGTPQPTGILVGSGNMTFSGLCVGHEHALTSSALSGNQHATLVPGVKKALAHLEIVFAAATTINEDFIARYAAGRPKRPSLPEEDRRADLIDQESPTIPIATAAALASAQNLWVEIAYVVPNRGKHEEGSQIDLQRGSRVFFGFGDGALPRSSPIGTVDLVYEGHSASRNLRFGHNAMDKLDLPIPGIEGPSSYRDQTLLFTRAGRNRFRITVGSPTQIAEWKRRSRRSNGLFAMKGGREFGVF